MKVLLTIFFITVLITTSAASDNTLKLVHVFFRHGARTPGLQDIYPTDPYTAKDFEPMGYGALTNQGKQGAYKLGLKLRQLYDEFLGDTYYPEMVEVNSTDVERTKMTALLVLAGLFKPRKQQIWNEELNWMPIPINYEKFHLDYVFPSPVYYCPKFAKELNKVLQSDPIKNETNSQKQLFDYIQKHTNKTISTVYHVSEIFQTLTAEVTMNLPLPEWAQSIYPDKMEKVVGKVSLYENYNPILKRLNGGRMLSKVIKQMIAKSKGKLEKKIYLYAGHETNVLSLLAALDLFEPHASNYAAAVIIELHYSSKTNHYGVKVLYIRDVDEEAEEKQLKGCDIICPLKKFIRITKPIIPVNYTAECNSKIYLN